MLLNRDNAAHPELIDPSQGSRTMSGTTPTPPTAARPEELSVHPTGQPDQEGQAVLDFLRGEYAAAGPMTSTSAVPTFTGKPGR